jgi:ribonuclease-3
MAKSVGYLEEKIGYRFTSPELLRQALTHKSRLPPKGQENPHYERLEFLGDSILGFVVSEHLVVNFSQAPEGQLTKLKSFLVCAGNLVTVARHLDLGSHLILGPSEEASGGRSKKGLLADVLEALIAAIYLDGGITAACDFITRTILSQDALMAAENNLSLDNFKSALQEFLHAHKLPAPVYKVVKESGPHHERLFSIEVNIGDLFHARALGESKKSAAQEAARLALEHIRKIHPQN